MSEPLYQIRLFGDAPGDLELVNSWRESHGAPPMPEAVVPPLAIFSELDGEPVAFAACYQSYGVGVCFMEWLATKPGMTLSQSRRAVGHVVDGLKACTRDTHGLMMATCSPGVARGAQHFGFQVTSDKAVQIATITG